MNVLRTGTTKDQVSAMRLKKLMILAFSAAAFASAQRAELSGFAGGGAFAVSSGGSAGLGQAGAQGCFFCAGRFALFGEYSHWFSGNNGETPFGVDRVASADLAGAGVRIQAHSRVRFFFDAGLVGGQDRHNTGQSGAVGGIGWERCRNSWGWALVYSPAGARLRIVSTHHRGSGCSLGGER